MKEYVVGFLFDKERREVVLVKKNRPEWQAGKLNGVGGKIEEGETPLMAMHREFKEETGHRPHSWHLFAVLSWELDAHHADAGAVYFFHSSHEGLPTLRHLVGTITDEKIEVVPLHDLPARLKLPNLNWLVPMALHHKGPPLLIKET